MEVVGRRDEIVYSKRIRSDLCFCETVGAYRKLIIGILTEVEPTSLTKIKHPLSTSNLWEMARQ